MTMIDDLTTDAQVCEDLALEAINAAANAVGTDELACLQAAEDLLAQAAKDRNAIADFWASVPDNAWSWDDNNIVSIHRIAWGES